MRWGVLEWTECNTGGGEEIKGYEDGGPPTLYQPASQQGGRRRWKNLAGGAWGGGRCAGDLGWIFIRRLSLRLSIFNHLCAVDWPACPMYQFMAELKGRRCLEWKWKFCRLCLFSCLGFLIFVSVLETGWGRKYLQNKCLIYFEASGSSLE